MFDKTLAVARKYGAKASAVAATAMVTVGQAMAQSADPASGVAAVTQMKNEMGDYGPLFFGIAIVGTGIMIGVKWIKRTKSAA